MNMTRIQRVRTCKGRTKEATHRVVRVAAYCRVSTDSDEQETSFEAQCCAYTEMINNNPDWEFAGIFADEGISGTRTKNRKGFRKMVEACERGKIDLIITKSISRFARNTLDCLTNIRYLQSYGVEFIFEKENIDTRAAFSEMLLTVLAAFAQEESRSISENLKWGIRKRFEEGRDRWARIYGYTSDGENDYLVQPEEAMVVQKVFELYEHGKGVTEIIHFLSSEGIPSPSGKENWLPSAVYVLLNNEKYAGDIILQKKYTVDHISHREVKNDGVAVPAYFIRDHHTPLVSHKTFDRVQLIKQMRSQNSAEGSRFGNTKVYPFGDMLKCPLCNEILVRRKLHIQEAGYGWCCNAGDNGMTHFILKDQMIHTAVLEAYNTMHPETIQAMSSGVEAAHMLAYKEHHPILEQVDYFWLDDLVYKIRIGKHENSIDDIAEHTAVDDRVVTVIWKCGLASTVSSGVLCDNQYPQNIAEKYNAFLIRTGKLNVKEDSEEFAS